MTVASNLIQSPIDLDGVSIGIQKLYGDLAACPAASFKRNRGPMLAQAIAHAKNFFKCGNFKSDMMELVVLRRA